MMKGSGEHADNGPESMKYAGFWLRFAAAMIDIAIVVAVFIGCGVFYWRLTGRVVDDRLSVDAFLTIIGITNYTLAILFCWLYFAWLESSPKQATLGKMLLNLAVTDLHGERVSFFRATGRHVGKVLSVLSMFVGFMMAGFTRNKQALHDKIARCLVVER
ncbi:RDD family protein [Gemmatimonadota bacterium]